MDRDAKLRELQELQARADKLRAEIEVEAAPKNWPPQGYYLSYHVMSGMMLGFVGAVVSLLFNVVGAILTKQHPLQLIRVYLTFPLGDKALEVDGGLVLAVGAMLYIFTGMGFGVPFHLIMSRFFDKAPVSKKVAIGTAMGLGLWIVNYYLILSWLQPALFGGNWIVSMIPWWVGAGTHLTYAWTMGVVDQWGKFEPPAIAGAGAAAAAPKA